MNRRDAALRHARPEKDLDARLAASARARPLDKRCLREASVRLIADIEDPELAANALGATRSPESLRQPRKELVPGS